MSRREQLEKERERRLSGIANSITGFYRESSQLDRKSERTIDSHAKNIGKIRNPQKPPLPQRERDPELERIYGSAAKGMADLSMLSDWEKDSQLSGGTSLSLFTGHAQNNRVRGLESIYLQRLDVGTKRRAAAVARKKKPIFRNMHHKYHDEARWYNEMEKLDDLESINSEVYHKNVERNIKGEFSEEHSQSMIRKPRGVSSDDDMPNIFHGNLNHYKERKYKAKVQTVDLGT